MYIAIVSGQWPDNGVARYLPGDIYLTTPVGIVGIEVGSRSSGGAGNTITEGAAGSTYNLNSNGYTQSCGTTDAGWSMDPLGTPTPVQMNINGASTKIGDADYAYTRNDQTDQHAVIELALDITNLLGEGLIGIHWSPSCGNDVVMAFFQASMPPTSVEVPEPSSALVWLLGVAAIGAMRARQRKSR
jgi:MYXO-CTERM domain-containing protein